jgi:hypothetical protein
MIHTPETMREAAAAAAEKMQENIGIPAKFGDPWLTGIKQGAWAASADIATAIRAIPLAPASTTTPQPPPHVEAAQVLHSINEAFMGGQPVDMDAARRINIAASFGAQAYAVCPMPEARSSAMLRAFLLAMIDPMDPELDYLRAKNVARAVTSEVDPT